MIEFSTGKYKIQAFIAEAPAILNHYKKHAVFIDERDLASSNKYDTIAYVIISNISGEPGYSIIAFKSFPIGHAGFTPGLHFEQDTDTLFIAAGGVIKTYRLSDHKLIFERADGFGFWGWTKYSDYIIQQEELEFGIFNHNGERLWRQT